MLANRLAWMDWRTISDDPVALTPHKMACSLVAALTKHKLAKWTLATVVPANFSLQGEVFVKPSTTKLIIDQLGLDLTYGASPSWMFYQAFRDALMTMCKIATDVKTPNNAAFSGFLMMGLSDRAPTSS